MTRIDIILPTFNRPGPLVKCLSALAGIPGSERLRVIVVDDGSDVAAESQIPSGLRERLTIGFLRVDNGGPAAARNAGLAAATAEYIAFVDDDVHVDPGWLRGYERALESGNQRTAYIGPLRAPANWKATPWNWWEAATLAVEYQKMIDGVYEPTWRQFFTGNALVPRALLMEAGGFDASFTRAEDIELGARLHDLGAEFRFVPDAIGWHYAYRSLRSWQAIPKAYGRFDVAIDTLHPGLHHVETITEELAGRRGGVIRALSTGRARGLFTFGTTMAGIAAGRMGLRQLSTPLLSLAYDADYRDAFASEVRRREGEGGREQPVNSASTTVTYAQPQ